MTAAIRKSQSSASASAVGLVGAVVTMVANFAIAFLVIGESKEFAGAFWSASALVTISGAATALGTNTGLVYFMPRATGSGRFNTRGLTMHAVAAVVPLSAGIAIILFLAAPLISNLIIGNGAGAEAFETLLRLMAPGVVGWAVTASLLGGTRGLGSMTPTVVISQIFRPGFQTVGIAAVFALGDAPAVWKIGLAWVLPVLLGAVFTAMTLVRMGGFQQGTGEPAVPRTEFWDYTKPRALSGALQISLERIDVLIITALLGAGLSGIYATVSRFATAGNFLIFSVAQAISPNLRKVIAAEQWDQARSQLRQATSWMVLIAWPYFLVLAFKSEAMAGLFDQPELLSGSKALMILGFGMMASAAAGPVDLALLMLGRSKESLWGSALAFATDIIGLFLLAKPFGLAGAAVAWAASVAVQNGVATLLTYKHGRLFGPGRPSLVASVGAGLAVVPVALLTPQTFTGLVVVGAVALPIMAGWIYGNRRTLGLA